MLLNPIIAINKTPLILSLFSGIGGLDLVFHSTGDQIAIAIESNSTTASQYQKNLPQTKVLNQDIRKVTPKQIAQLLNTHHPNWQNQPLIIIGGSPCQGFSQAGKRNPLDPRNELIGEYLKLVQALNPTCFLLENVPGLLAPRNQNLINQYRQTITTAGYTLSEWQLNAADYGVPQNRDRLFWIGSKYGEILPPQPYTQTTTVKEAIADIHILESQLNFHQDEITWQPEQRGEYAHYLLDLFPPPTEWNSTKLTGCQLTNHSPQVIQRFLTTANGEKEPISHSYRLDWNGVAPTLKAGGDAQRHTAVRPIHPESPRVITVREAARLQSFPDWFEFSSTKINAHKQIGNAVPPLLACQIATQIQQHLESNLLIYSVSTSGSQKMNTFPVGTKVKLTKKLQERAKGSVGKITEIINPTYKVVWDEKLPGVIDFTELPPEFFEVVSLPEEEQIQEETQQFNYDCFSSKELAQQAKTVKTEFLSFVSRTFNELVTLGQKLNQIQSSCINQQGTREGKSTFNQWLDSKEFGSSKYLAKSAMAISNWYFSLELKLQKWVSRRVTRWSVAALRELSKATGKMIKILIKESDGTAGGIKKRLNYLTPGEKVTDEDWELVARKLRISDQDLDTLKQEALQQPSSDLETGEKELKVENLIQTLNNFGYDSDKLLPKHQRRAAKEQRLVQLWEQHQIKSDEFINADSETTKNQLNAELNQINQQLDSVVKSLGLTPDQGAKLAQNLIAAKTPTTYTAEEVEEKIRIAIAQYETASQQRQIAELTQIREEALNQAKAEIQAAQEGKNQAKQETTQLRQELEKLQGQIAQTQSLQQQLTAKEQRIADLEKMLKDANNRWHNTLTTEAAQAIETKLTNEYQQVVDFAQQRIQELETENKLLKQKQPLTEEELFSGAKVLIIQDDQWEGYTGVVASRNGQGWWVELRDGKNQTFKKLFKPQQLTTHLPPVDSLAIQVIEQRYHQENRILQARLQQQETLLKQEIAEQEKTNKLLAKRNADLSTKLHQQTPRELQTLLKTPASKFGVIASDYGIPRWTSQGYISNQGKPYKDNLLAALLAFVGDVMSNPLQLQTV